MKSGICSSGFTLFVVFTVALWVVAPRRLPASGLAAGGGSNPHAQQTNGSTGEPQSRPSKGRTDGPGNHQWPDHPRPTRPDGDNSHSSPTQPNPDPRPSQPPQPGGPVVNPGKPASGPSHPPVQGPPPNHLPPRPPAHPHPVDRWGRGNRWLLYQYFLGNRPAIGPLHRQHFHSGGYLTLAHVRDMQPIPAGFLVDLPPVPAGYSWGYYDGYYLVYDPHTLRIVTAIDLYAR